MNIVLVIGETPEQAQSLAERLGLAGVEAIPCARDWKLAVTSLAAHKLSLILLDVDGQTETMDFFAVLRDLSHVPIVARGVGNNGGLITWYLDNGAADYIGRGVSPALIVAKVQALLRMRQPAPTANQIQVGELAIDLDRYSVSKRGTTISLTPIEFRLLRVLAQNAGRACSHDELLELVWGESFKDCAHYLRLYMGYLRNKIEDEPRRPKMLVTEWGYGYRLVEADGVRGSGRARGQVHIAASG